MVHKDSQSIYGEVDALVTLLNYQTTNSGCCKVVLHPRWGARCTPPVCSRKRRWTPSRAAVADAERAIRAANADA